MKAQHINTPPEETNKEMTEAEREKIGSYEEAFEKIKEETGVNSMNVSTTITKTSIKLSCRELTEIVCLALL